MSDRLKFAVSTSTSKQLYPHGGCLRYGSVILAVTLTVRQPWAFFLGQCQHFLRSWTTKIFTNINIKCVTVLCVSEDLKIFYFSPLYAGPSEGLLCQIKQCVPGSFSGTKQHKQINNCSLQRATCTWRYHGGRLPSTTKQVLYCNSLFRTSCLISCLSIPEE